MKEDNKLKQVFSNLTDPRSHINRLHLLNDILLIGIVSVICGAALRSTSRIQKNRYSRMSKHENKWFNLQNQKRCFFN